MLNCMEIVGLKRGMNLRRAPYYSEIDMASQGQGEKKNETFERMIRTRHVNTSHIFTALIYGRSENKGELFSAVAWICSVPMHGW